MRIVIFVGLKIGEAVVIVFVPYLMGLLFLHLGWFSRILRSPFDTWVVGLLGILVPAVVCFGLIGIVAANWNWAGDLKNKLRG